MHIDPTNIYIGAGVGALIGFIMLAVARHLDKRNYIIQKATPMSISMANERDDIWARGKVVTAAPRIAPHFGFECAYYSYKLEERVRSGKNSTTWRTRESSEEHSVFTLMEENAAISVDTSKASLKDLMKKTYRQGSWRHTVKYIPNGARASVIGSVSEGKRELEPHANIPLLITPKSREDFLKSAERIESILRGVGFFLILVGFGVLMYAGFISMNGNTRPPDIKILYSVLVAIGAFTPVWALYIYNTLVSYDVRVENAWRQIDVDLKMRYELIPNLVGAVKGLMKHESKLLESLVDLRKTALQNRKSRISTEGKTSGALGELMIVAEKYPDLKSSGAISKLMEQLSALEEKIAHARNTFNETVEEYNINVMSFPRVIIARIIGLKTKDMFTAVGTERRVVSASLKASK